MTLTELPLDMSALLAESLADGQSVRFRAEGRSMEPFLFAGDWVVVSPIRGTAPPRPGDVLLYRRGDGGLRLHRFVLRRPQPKGPPLLKIRGDAVGQNIEWVGEADVLGVLEQVERRGRLLASPRRRATRWAGLWWPRLRNRLPGQRTARRNAAARTTDHCVDLVLTALRLTLRQRPFGPPGDRAGARTDPRRLVGCARRHGVLGLCANGLMEALPEARATIRTTVRALALEGEADRSAMAAALRALSAHGLEPQVVKGPALGALVYSDPTHRPSDDLDLLLDGRDRPRALHVLSQLGWRDSRNSPTLAQRHLLRTTEDIALRLPGHHIGIELIHPGGLLHATALPCRQAPQVPFHLLDVQAAAPEPVEHFLYCVAHGGKHGWTRLIWLADLDRLSAAFTAADWERAIRLARERRLTRPLALACALAGDLLDMPAPREALEPWVDSRWLRHAVAACLHGLRDGQRHVAAGRRWWGSLQDTRRQRFRLWRWWLLRPTGADLRWWLLPLWAHPLYAVVRPVRLGWRLLAGRPAPLEWPDAPEN